MIRFNKPTVTGYEDKYIMEAFQNQKFSGDGPFTKLCNQWFEEKLGTSKALLTTSCTHALEMAAILADIQEGDEVIMPSYTFVSTANAFVLRGAKVVFVDIKPDTMNIDETLVEEAVTGKTKAIVVVHYAGVSCEMDEIMRISREHNLLVVEDAAQGVMSTYKGKSLGTIGHLGCFSFHETKNYQCGEGGALLINDDSYVERAEIIREKGTDRSKFFRGQVDKYSWVDMGSSYLPSEVNAAFLYAQLQYANDINEDRLASWSLYYQKLKDLADKDIINLPTIPKNCEHNAHMFYIKVDDINERGKLIAYMKEHDITCVFHYVPLHNSSAGVKYSHFYKGDQYTTSESEKLIRLPLYYGMSEETVSKVTEAIYDFFESLGKYRAVSKEDLYF